ncbi:hypothetical protein ES703_116752 [subsurface metagenome]
MLYSLARGITPALLLLWRALVGIAEPTRRDDSPPIHPAGTAGSSRCLLLSRVSDDTVLKCQAD